MRSQVRQANEVTEVFLRFPEWSQGDRNMLTNEQAINAIRILPHIETVDLRSQAIHDLLLKKNLVSEQDVKDAMSAAKGRIAVKWSALQTKLESFLREQNDI